jgi:hypothetical protein
MKAHLNRTVNSVLRAEIALYFTINKELRFYYGQFNKSLTPKIPPEGTRMSDRRNSTNTQKIKTNRHLVHSQNTHKQYLFTCTYNNNSACSKRVECLKT